MVQCVAQPLSRRDIQDFAMAVRFLVGKENEQIGRAHV